MRSTDIGIMTSLFFLAITVPGFCLSAMVKCFKKMTIIISFIMMLTGLLFICFFFKNVMIGIGCLLVGWGDGILQPLIFDKTTNTCNS